MKKLFVVLFFIVISGLAFSDDLPTFMVETNAGYAIGVNLDNAMQTDAKLYYSFKRFGFAAEAGALTSTDNSAFHMFLGPMFYFINTDKWRVPLVVGFDLITQDTTFFGVGATVSLHRRLSNFFYTGLNLGISYAFDNPYEEITGYKTTVTKFDDGTTKSQTAPVLENKSHPGTYMYFKPSLVVGLQF